MQVVYPVMILVIFNFHMFRALMLSCTRECDIPSQRIEFRLWFKILF